RLARHVAPPFVQLCGAAPPALQGLRAADLPLHLRGRQPLLQGRVHVLERRRLFFHSVITVLVRTGTTRAVARIPLAWRAIPTICALTTGDGPGELSSRSNVHPAPRCARHRSRCVPGRVWPWRTMAVP